MASLLNSMRNYFYQKFKEDIILIPYKFFQNIEEERILPNSSYAASIVLMTKPDKCTICKENYRSNISYEHRHK
jgi:hypothetical protein